jgi:hypothetical protein
VSASQPPLRYYHVKCWEPPREERRFGSHRIYGVVTHSATSALTFISATYPHCRIDAVNDQGIVHHALGSPPMGQAFYG